MLPEITYVKDPDAVDSFPPEELPVRSLGSIEGGKGHGPKVFTLRDGRRLYQRKSLTAVEISLDEQTGETTLQRIRHGRATDNDKPPLRPLHPSQKPTPHEYLQTLRGETPNTKNRLAQGARLSDEQERARIRALRTNKRQVLLTRPL